MSEHTLQELLVRLVPFVMFALILALAIRNTSRNPLARGGPFVAKLSGLCVDDPALEARLVAALRERRKMEPVPISAKVLGAAWLCAFAGGLGAGLAGAIPRVQIPMWYGVACLSLAAIMMYAHFQMRAAPPVRVAVLQARSSATVIPPYWFAAAFCGAAMTLAFAAQPALRAAAILVCVSSLATMAIARHLTSLPARLAGNDIEAERFVDAGLRFRRSAKVLLLAILQPYMFMCLMLKDANAVETAAWILTILLFLGFVVWMIRSMRRQPALIGAA